MYKLIGILFLIWSSHSFGQNVTYVDRSHFKIDSLQFDVSKIKYIKKIEEPFIRGGDAKYARKAEVFFRLKNASSLSVSFGDSSYLEFMLSLKKELTEYYSFSDAVSKTDDKTIYTYSLKTKPGEYALIVTSIQLSEKKYFMIIDADAKDLEYAFELINDLQALD